MVCYSRRALPTGRMPYRTTRSAPTPGSPHIVCSGTTRACKNSFERGGDVLGGEERRLLLSHFQKRYAACSCPCPGSRSAAGACPGRRSLTGAARLRMGGEEESARTGDSNPGCNYLVRGYGPSMRPGSRPLKCVMAGGRAPMPGAGVTVLRAGWRAQARAPGRGRIRARWPASPRTCPAQGSRTGAA